MATTLSHLYLTRKLYQPSYTSLFTLSSVKHRQVSPFLFLFLLLTFSNSLCFHCRTFKVLFCLSLKQSDDRTVITHDSSAEKLRVVFAAGGTGGHIYPAIAIADELKVTKPTTEILFIGTPNSMESDAILSAGYEFATVPAARLARPILSLRNVLLPYHLIKSTIPSYHKLSDFKPHIVVGTGGYVSFPICLAAVLNGIKLVIQEQNSVPGIANWVLSHLANVVFVAFNSTLDYFPKGKCVVSGNPVRLSLKKYVSKAVARLHFFPKSGKIGESEAKVLIILGGSLGANAINIAMLNIYSQMLLENKNLFIIWQTGVEAYNEMESLVKNHRHLFLTP